MIKHNLILDFTLQYADPLAFHGGKVETLSGKEYQGPSSAKLVEFIRVRMVSTIIMHSFFLAILLFRMLTVIGTESSRLSSSDSALLTAIIALPILLPFALLLFLHRTTVLEKLKKIKLYQSRGNSVS